MSKNIIVEIENYRATVTLNRPEKHNAMSVGMQKELQEALWSVDQNADVRSVLLRGAGPSFCAGYDLEDDYDGPSRGGGFSPTAEKERSVDDDAWRMERSQTMILTVFDMHKPVVCEVHGNCLAGGAGLALAADMIVAADDARIGFPPARDLGIMPVTFWLYHVGPQWAKRLNLTGDLITGEDAAKIGLVLKSVPPDRVHFEAAELADRLALVDADMLSANKRIMNLGLELMGARTLQRLAAEHNAAVHTSAARARFVDDVRNLGLKKALINRDEPFGDNMVRVDGPEIRDERGHLLPADASGI